LEAFKSYSREKSMVDPYRLLAVFPHPDDETLGLGGTLAKYSAEGIETYLVCATRGERGWSDSLGPDPGLEAVGRIRELELKCAAVQLGLKEVTFLDFLDGDVDQADPMDAITRIATQIRRLKPQVVVTFPPDGAYGHPDHIALSQFTTAACVCAADASFRELNGLAPHRVSKFYYRVDSRALVIAGNQLFGGISMEVDGNERQDIAWADWQITTRIDGHQYMDSVYQAVHCHKSQLPNYGLLTKMAPGEMGDFFTEGTFYRAFSFVNGGRRVETDLFEGIR
jgi:LmbE family N-acetylglucosaminyl deacetylase